LNPLHFATSATVVPNLNNTNINTTEALPSIQNHSLTSSAVVRSNTNTTKFEKFTFPDREKTKILIVGCGNSKFGEEMIRDGWTGKITNVDFSSVVIQQMQSRYGTHFYNQYPRAESMDFICADITQTLPFEDASFDLIVCKGTLDAVLCSAGSKANALSMVRECHRLLAPGHGIFFLVTNGNPDNRIEYLEHQNQLNHYWRGVSVHILPKLTSTSTTQDEKPVYAYICRKRMTNTSSSSSSLVTTTTSKKDSPGNKENIQAPGNDVAGASGGHVLKQW
jgi:SAM-dependent methyltransferase